MYYIAIVQKLYFDSNVVKIDALLLQKHVPRYFALRILTPVIWFLLRAVISNLNP